MLIRLIDIETGNMSKLMVPGFQSPVFNVRSATTFREDKDDNKVFSLTAGRWMCEQGEGTYQNIEIFDIAFGAAHRASVSVASTLQRKIFRRSVSRTRTSSEDCERPSGHRANHDD